MHLKSTFVFPSQIDACGWLWSKKLSQKVRQSVPKKMLCDAEKLWVFVVNRVFLAVKGESHLLCPKNDGMRVCAKMMQNKCNTVLKYYGGV